MDETPTVTRTLLGTRRDHRWSPERKRIQLASGHRPTPPPGAPCPCRGYCASPSVCTSVPTGDSVWIPALPAPQSNLIRSCFCSVSPSAACDLAILTHPPLVVGDDDASFLSYGLINLAAIASSACFDRPLRRLLGQSWPARSGPR